MTTSHYGIDLYKYNIAINHVIQNYSDIDINLMIFTILDHMEIKKIILIIEEFM